MSSLRIASQDTGTLASGDVQISIGERARHGSVWMVAATGAAKGTSVIAQLALAWLMSRREYGVYAMAISLASILSIIKDGGLPTVLVQKARRFDVYAGPAFWMMLALNAVTGLAIALVAAPAARFYALPELKAVIELFAISVPLCVPASLMNLRLTSEMRFREVGIVQIVSAVVRNSLLLVFACLGFGAKSFILPTLVTNVTDALLLWHLTHYAPWLRPLRPRCWPRLMRSGRWVLLGTFAFALGNNGVYFLIGRMLPADVVGTYFFAFQVITSLAMLLSNNSYQVLFAAFSRVRDDTARLRGAVLQALKVVVLIASAVSLAIAAVFRPLEHVLWHGKWASAVGAVEVFAVTWPLIAFISVLHAVQAARGRFRVWGLVALVTSIAAVAGSVLGALLGRTATAAAIGYGIGTVVGMLVNIQYSLVPLGLWPFTTTLTSLRPWVAAIVAAAVAAAVGRSLSGHDPAAVALSAACFVVAGYWSLRLLARDSMRLTMSSVAPIVVRALGRLRPASGNG